MATYRVGNHQPQNIYRGDTYIGVMFTAQDAALVVETLNQPTGDPGPAWCHGSPTLAGAICGRLAPHGPHDRCERLDCDHWHCAGRQP